LISRTNKYIDENEPWVLIKDEEKKARLGNVMAHLVESLRVTAIMLQPFLTQAPKAIFSQIGITNEAFQSWESLHEIGELPEAVRVEKGSPSFPRLDMEDEVARIKAFMQPPKQEEPEEAESQNEITYDEFMKVDLRVGEVLQCEKMKNADKLLKFQVDLGSEKRQIISGIAEFYEPETLIGRKVIVVANLKPVKLRGELSEGMILSGEDDEGNLSLAKVNDSLPNGSAVK